MAMLGSTREIERSGVSPRTWILLGCLAFLLRYLFQGYIIFRGDQLELIAQLFALEDPSLYPRDVFLHGYALGDIRYFYLQLVRTTAALLGLPLSLFVLYVVFFTLTLLAWFRISKRLFDSYTPAFFFALLLVFHQAGRVAGNDIIEKLLLPRMVAYTCCWWAIYAVLVRDNRLGAFLAGLILGAGVLVHVGVPTQFWPVLALWILIRKRREGVVPVLILSASFGAFLIPSILKTLRMIGSYMTFFDPDAYVLWTYVRVPHHLLLSTWGTDFYALIALVVLWGLVWWPLRHTHRVAWEFGLLSAIVVVVLAVAAIFIAVWPIKNVVLAQPYRLAVVLRAIAYLFLGHHIAALAKRRMLWPTIRAAALVACGYEGAVLLCVLIAEIIIILLERHAPTSPHWLFPAVLLIALAIACLLGSENRRVVIPALIVAGVSYWAIPRPHVRRWFARRGLPIAVGSGGVLVVAMGVLPLEKWIGNSDSRMQVRLAKFCFKHALRPFPIDAIEKAGAWAERNTPKDALFLIPPGKEQAGFHPWAKRSVFFSVKFFPYQPEGVTVWKERYLAVRGLSGADRSRIEAAIHALGAKGADKDYANLTLEQVLGLVRVYEIDYVVSEHAPPYQSPEMAQVFQAIDSHSHGDNLLYVYRVISRRE